jgi:hypothetical protein
VLTLPDAFNPAHRSARLGDDRIMIRPHNMLSIFVLLQSHIDFLCGYEARPICLPRNRRQQDTKTETRFFMGQHFACCSPEFDFMCFSQAVGRVALRDRCVLVTVV